MARYWNKANVYHEVDRLRAYYGIPLQPLNSFQIICAICPNAYFDILDMQSKDICGILFKGMQVTMIGLNRLHTKQQQNFYCAHEFMHYCWHDKDDQTYICKNILEANDISEWQANEGASELLIPYRTIIPELIRFFRNCCVRPSPSALYTWICQMANKYHVSERVLEYRINSLVYETMQYVAVPDFSQIIFLSRRKQLEQGMNYNVWDIYDAIFSERNSLVRFNGAWHFQKQYNAHNSYRERIGGSAIGE